MSNVQWKVQINDGDVQDFETKTGQYGLACVAALAHLDYKESDLIIDGKNMNIIKIWCEKLLPDYDPYYYAFDGSILYSAFGILLTVNKKIYFNEHKGK